MSFRHWDTFHRMRRFCAHTGTAARPLSQHDRSPCIRPPHSRVIAAIAARGQLRGQLLAADTHAFECWMCYALILLFATIDGRSSTSLLHTPLRTRVRETCLRLRAQAFPHDFCKSLALMYEVRITVTCTRECPTSVTRGRAGNRHFEIIRSIVHRPQRTCRERARPTRYFAYKSNRTCGRGPLSCTCCPREARG